MRLRVHTGFLFVVAAIATIPDAHLQAQTAPSPQQPSARQPVHGTASAVKPQPAVYKEGPVGQPQGPTSLLDQPAQPAQVQLAAGKLSVKADNSTLSDILHDISTKTGMTIDGLSRDQRVFGNYGPATPREVLSALLDGMGYNVMMVGALDNGAPRQLNLTPRSGGAIGGSADRQAPAARPASNDNSEDEDPAAGDSQDAQPPQPEPNRPETPPQPEQQQNQPGQVKTPQQMLQELQQMRMQQQQPQQSNPQ